MKKAFELFSGLIILLFMGVVFWQITSNENTNQGVVPFYQYEPPVRDSKGEFAFRLEEQVKIELGQPIEGYEPQMFMQVFPGLEPADFNNVEAEIGIYKYQDGELKHEIPQDVLIHSAAPAVSKLGMETLFDNVSSRLHPGPKPVSVGDLIAELKIGDVYSSDFDSGTGVCATDVKLCPDGSSVGRTGPECEFATCPSVPQGNNNCTDKPVPPGICPEGGTFTGWTGPNCEIAGCSIPSDEPVACTMDAKMCPDGSFVGRVGPNCEFAECPATTEPELIVCTPDSRLAEYCAELYDPVCGRVEVQCITEPCDPVPETFSNACFACVNENVIGYTQGSCEG